jgi:predicted permease
VVLLAAAGLMLESFRRLRDVQPGVQVDGVLAVDVALPYARYDSYARTAAFYRELLGGIEALPGVQRAGGTGWLPLDDDQGCSMVLTERAVPAGQEPPCVATVQVAPGYFAALGIALRGAAPGWEETERGAAGAVVSRALAARLWPGEDPIGRGIKGGNRGEFFRVVGVTGDVRADGLDQPASQVVYFPMVPARGAMLWSPPNYMRVVVRTAGGAAPESLVPAVRRLVAGLDPEVPLANARTMREVVAKSTARVSFTMALLATAAAMALVLSAVGLYGVLAYLVSLRTRELGVRVALGARPAELRRLVVLQSARLVAAGVAVGLAGALAATGVLRSLLFDVSPTDPRVLAAVSLLLCTVALAASYLPARRATAADPMAALRSE